MKPNNTKKTGLIERDGTIKSGRRVMNGKESKE